ncbi:mucin-3B-like, partial [Carlito syrichta]|uniref:Mucin-3B-like n=1 Tax=Carlito syrichta TaxID=1868482 RepID=A0A1U7TLB5_CARSF
AAETPTPSLVTTATVTSSHGTPSFTSSNIDSTVSTSTTAVTSAPTTLGTLVTSPSIRLSSLITHIPTTRPTTITHPSVSSTGSVASTTDLTSTVAPSSSPATSTHLTPSTPTIPITEPSSLVSTTSAAISTTRTTRTSAETPPTSFLSTSLPVTPSTFISTYSPPLVTSHTGNEKSQVTTTLPPSRTDTSMPSLHILTPSMNSSSAMSTSHVHRTSTPLSSLQTFVSTPSPQTSLTSTSPSTTKSFTRGSTSTNAIVTSFSTIISSSTPSVTMSSSVSPTSTVPVFSTTTHSVSSSPHTSTTENTGSSSVTALSTLPSSATSSTSLTISSPATTLTEITPFSYISLPSTTPCPETITITIVPTSPTVACVEVGPGIDVTSPPTTPLSVLPFTTEMVTFPGSTSMRTVLPTYMATSPSVTPEGELTNLTSGVPSSPGTGTASVNTVWTSTQVPTRDWVSTSSLTSPYPPGVTAATPPTKPSSTLPTAMRTSSKLTYPTSPTTRTPETPVATTQTTTTLTSPKTTRTTTQMTTQTRLTTTPGTCDNGGTWAQGQCLCLPGFSGDRCELQEIKCQNGGTWDGLKCNCPSTFYGSYCEFAVEQVDLDTVEAEVGMEVSVDQEFSEELNDNTSKVYQDFSNNFRDQMQKVYQNVQGFKDVEILSLRSGSIVVDYLVLLELSFSLNLDREYEKVKTALKEELQNASQDGDGCKANQTMCFKPDSIKVNNNTSTELTPEAICRRAVPEGYEEFYFPLVEANRLRCVTRCTSGVDGAFDCNQGQCILEKSGPACRSSDENRKWFAMWDEETVGTFSNLGFEDDAVVKKENFCVALENVDTSLKVHIKRPEVTSSSL